MTVQPAIHPAASGIDRAALTDSRRAPRPPTRLRRELLRSRLVDRFGERFDVPVTVVHAGAGFGKTTAIAQAMRANVTAPRGIDVWLACEATDDENRLASAVLDAIAQVTGRPPARRPSTASVSNVERVVAALIDIAPVDVCLIFDDAHEIGSSSSGYGLLCGLTRMLPFNSHLVIASRNDTELPLARLRAAGRVHEITESELAFTEAEVAEIAQLHGTESERAEGVAGWPSLVQLTFAARRGAATAFLWEEIIGALAPVDRMAMLALATLGSGTAQDVAAVAGTRVDLEHLAACVPLIHVDECGRYGAHGLWTEAVERVFARGELADVRRRALTILHRNGDTIRLGSAAALWSDDDWLCCAALDLVSETWGEFPVGIAQSWLSDASPATRDIPEIRLLSAAVRQHLEPNDPGLDDEVDQLIDTFRAADDRRGEVRSIALGSVIAHGRNDYIRIAHIADQARRVSDADNITSLRFLVGSVDAAMASLRGHIEESLRIISNMPVDDVPPDARRLITRLEAAMLMLTGHSHRSVETLQRHRDAGDEEANYLHSFFSWQAGIPGRFLTEQLLFEPAEVGGLIDQIVYTAEVIAISAGLGNRAVASEASGWLARIPRDSLDARLSAFTAVADACTAVCVGDEDAAAQRLADHLARHVTHPLLAEVHLRRHPAVVYVLNERLRDWWRSTDPGPTHAQSIAVAQQLLDVRAGQSDPTQPLPDPGVAITSMPLPWTIELGLRAHALGHPDAVDFTTRVVELLGDSARSELDRHVDGASSMPDDCLVAAARTVRKRQPGTPSAHLTIEVLGPLRLSVDGRVIEPPGLRRGRVRTLITLLIVHGKLRRDQLTELMWPDSSPSDARRNLRVTLSRARSVLGADDPADGQLRLLADDDYVCLAPEPIVTTDLSTFRQRVRAADAAKASGSEAIGELTDAVQLWRGDPFDDLASIVGTEADVEIVRQELVGTALRLGELLHVAGRFDEAWKFAELVRSAAPYNERAHRLAVAAQLQRRDRAGVVAAVRAADEMFADLGVAPEEATQMLLRRASAFTDN